MSIIKPALIALAIGLGLGHTFAQAKVQPPTTFDFYQNGGGLFSSVSYSPNFISGGIGLTVTAKRADGSVAEVADRWDGLGVDSGGWFSVAEVTNGESLILTFSQAVNLTGLQLSMWESGFDGANLSGGGKAFNLGSMSNTGFIVNEFGFNSLTGTQFVLKGVGGVTSFRLAGVTVTSAVPTIPAIPEPGTWALMGLGLAGLAFVRRRT